MSEPVALITGEVIEPSEFRAFLQQEGATLDPDNSFDGRISEGNKHVWIALHNDLHEWEDFEIANIEGLLGHKARSHITLEVSRKEGSQQLAIDFAYEFAKRWKCVVDDLHGNVLSVEEFARQQQALTPTTA